MAYVFFRVSHGIVSKAKWSGVATIRAPSSPGLPNEEDGAVVPVSEPIEQVFDEVTFIDLTVDVLTLRNARWGMPDEPTRKSQVSLLTERKRRTSRASSKPS